MVDAIATSIAGITAANQKAADSARDVASGRLESGIIGLKQAAIAQKASAETLSAALETLGKTIDILV